MQELKNLPAAKHRKKKMLKAAKGFFGMRSNVLTVPSTMSIKPRQYAYRGPPRPQARVPLALDHPHQCGCQGERHDLIPAS